MNLIRFASAVIAASAAMAISTPAAQAAAPANDDVTGAVAITAIPSTVETDTDEATVASSDPTNACVGPRATVWYSLTVPNATRVQLDTVGSDYDTTLVVFTGAPGSLEPVACDDDTSGLTSAVRFDATAATTYLVMVGTCCGGETGDVGPGGHLVLNASVAPGALEASLTVDPRATVSKSGVVTVTGTLTCTAPASTSFVFALVTQSLGRFVARGAGEVDDPGCGPIPSPWEIPVSSDSGVLFGGGRAHVALEASVSDGFDFVPLQANTTVRLRRR